MKRAGKRSLARNGRSETQTLFHHPTVIGLKSCYGEMGKKVNIINICRNILDCYLKPDSML